MSREIRAAGKAHGNQHGLPFDLGLWSLPGRRKVGDFSLCFVSRGPRSSIAAVWVFFWFEHLPEVVLGCARWQLLNHSRNHSAEHPSALINRACSEPAFPFIVLYLELPSLSPPVTSRNESLKTHSTLLSDVNPSANENRGKG